VSDRKGVHPKEIRDSHRFYCAARFQSNSLLSLQTPCLPSYRNAFLVYIPVKRKTPGNRTHKSFFRKYLERNDGFEIMIPHNSVGNIIKDFFDFCGLIINKDGYVEIGIRASFSPDAGTKDDNSFYMAAQLNRQPLF
jgi:hypothetical protein